MTTKISCSILVDGCEPFSEDLWTEIKISNLAFHGVKLCDRCKVKAFLLSPHPAKSLFCHFVFKLMQPIACLAQLKMYFFFFLAYLGSKYALLPPRKLVRSAIKVGGLGTKHALNVSSSG